MCELLCVCTYDRLCYMLDLLKKETTMYQRPRTLHSTCRSLLFGQGVKPITSTQSPRKLKPHIHQTHCAPQVTIAYAKIATAASTPATVAMRDTPRASIAPLSVVELLELELELELVDFADDAVPEEPLEPYAVAKSSLDA